MSERHDLQRFRDAQAGGTYERALAELRAGDKTGHWMWFVFPQLDGLGRSPTARHYAIASLSHAREYLSDPLLGPRLRACCEALLALPPDASAERVLGPIDTLKLRSSMTLFARASGEGGEDGEGELFRAVLARFYEGAEDDATIRLLEADAG